MAMTYVCSPLAASTRAEMMENAARAGYYMSKAEQEFGDRAVAPHAVLPYILDDTIPEERALAMEFGMKLKQICMLYEKSPAVTIEIEYHLANILFREGQRDI